MKLRAGAYIKTQNFPTPG